MVFFCHRTVAFVALAAISLVLSRTGRARGAMNDLTIAVEGDCPGRLALRWEGATPGQVAALAYSDVTGRMVLPWGPCGSTVLGLGSSGARMVRSFQTGVDGRGVMGVHATAFACGGYVQILVMDDLPCTTSNVVQLPE